MTKAAIPAVLTGKATAQARNVDRLSPLPDTATLADVIVRLNAVVARLQ